MSEEETIDETTETPTAHTVIIRPTISFTVQNAKDDIGNTTIDLTPYMKTSDYEADKEGLVSDSELTTTLSDYTTNVGLENALSSYATKTLLSETVSDRPTFTYTDSTFAKLNANNTFTKPINITINDVNNPISALYNGNINNDNYIRFMIGDNTRQAIYGFGRISNERYAYMKMNGQSAAINVYDNKIKLLAPIEITGNTTLSGTLNITTRNGLTVAPTTTMGNSTKSVIYIGDNSKKAIFGAWRIATGSYCAHMKLDGGSSEINVYNDSLVLNSATTTVMGDLKMNNKTVSDIRTSSDTTATSDSQLITSAAVESMVSTKADTSHTHTLSDITDASTLIANVETLTDQMLATQSAVSGKANSTVLITSNVSLTSSDFTITLQTSVGGFTVIFNTQPISSTGTIDIHATCSDSSTSNVSVNVDFQNETASTSNTSPWICEFFNEDDEIGFTAKYPMWAMGGKTIQSASFESTTFQKHQQTNENLNDVVQFIVDYLASKDNSFISNLLSALNG